MTREETEMLLAYMEQFYSGTDEITTDTITAWHNLFRDDPASLVYAAGKKAVRSWRGSKIPPPGEVARHLDTSDTPAELWHEAMKLIRKGTVLTQEQFDQAPDEIKAYFGSVSGVRDIALMDLDQVGNEKARFLKAIPAIQQRLASRSEKLKLKGHTINLLAANNSQNCGF